ncbi:MAG: hypothetical protein QN141_13550 [Armatimonadota bacterium]|nr:hypothetical protein [Armatimonadota bacterium]
MVAQALSTALYATALAAATGDRGGYQQMLQEAAQLTAALDAELDPLRGELLAQAPPGEIPS